MIFVLNVRKLLNIVLFTQEKGYLRLSGGMCKYFTLQWIACGKDVFPLQINVSGEGN
jgi:hypothetical protein